MSDVSNDLRGLGPCMRKDYGGRICTILGGRGEYVLVKWKLVVGARGRLEIRQTNESPHMRQGRVSYAESYKISGL